MERGYLKGPECGQEEKQNGKGGGGGGGEEDEKVEHCVCYSITLQVASDRNSI